MKPTVSTLVPSTVTRNTGNRPWMISDDTSMNRLTRPRAQMPLGIVDLCDAVSMCCDFLLSLNQKTLMDFRIAFKILGYGLAGDVLDLQISQCLRVEFETAQVVGED